RNGGLTSALLFLAALEAVNIVWIVRVYQPSVVASEPSAPMWLPGYLGHFAAGMALALIGARAVRERPGAIVRAVKRSPLGCWLVAALVYVLVSTPLAGAIDQLAGGGARLCARVHSVGRGDRP
ncbi:hypothetical protein AB4Z54_74045, partial [Streptomyces sp. MCAF7]